MESLGFTSGRATSHPSQQMTIESEELEYSERIQRAHYVTC